MRTMGEISRHLAALRDTWISLDHIPDDLAATGLSNISKQSVTDMITSMSRMADELSAAPEEETVMVRRSCEQTIKLAEENLSEHLGQYPTIHMLGFLTLLYQIQSILAKTVAECAQEQGGRSNPSRAA